MLSEALRLDDIIKEWEDGGKELREGALRHSSGERGYEVIW